MRLFIAIEVPAAAALRAVRQALERMGPAVRPVGDEQLHLTLRFLGEVEESAAWAVGQAVEVAAGNSRPFELGVVGLGAFPSPSRPSVVWAGVAAPAALQALADAVDRALAPLTAAGVVPPRDRPFSPHLTLARVKARPPRELADLLSRHRQTAFDAFAIDQAHLLRSTLTPRGPIYQALTSPHLGGPSGQG